VPLADRGFDHFAEDRQLSSIVFVGPAEGRSLRTVAFGDHALDFGAVAAS
jgi:hypothetical protein